VIIYVKKPIKRPLDTIHVEMPFALLVVCKTAGWEKSFKPPHIISNFSQFLFQVLV